MARLFRKLQVSVPTKPPIVEDWSTFLFVTVVTLGVMGVVLWRFLVGFFAVTSS